MLNDILFYHTSHIFKSLAKDYVTAHAYAGDRTRDVGVKCGNDVITRQSGTLAGTLSIYRGTNYKVPLQDFKASRLWLRN